MPAIFSRQRAVGYILPAVIAALTGCSTTQTPNTHPTTAVIPQTGVSIDPEMIPVVRYGRYTLVELVPMTAQRDLLALVVEVSIPPRTNATVGSAFQHLLMHTGYRLCHHLSFCIAIACCTGPIGAARCAADSRRTSMGTVR